MFVGLVWILNISLVLDDKVFDRLCGSRAWYGTRGDSWMERYTIIILLAHVNLPRNLGEHSQGSPITLEIALYHWKIHRGAIDAIDLGWDLQGRLYLALVVLGLL